MAGTRSSSRLSGQSSSPAQNNASPKAAAGSKRKNETGASPTAKRGKKAAPKEQKTIEEAMADPQPSESSMHAPEADKAPTPTDQAMASEPSKTDENGKLEQDKMQVDDHDEPSHAVQSDADPVSHDPEDGVKDQDKPVNDNSKMDDTGAVVSTEPEVTAAKAEPGESAVEPEARQEETPSSILEKGIIYFFFRRRVGIDDPQQVDDIARSYMVMRPLPHGAKLGDGLIGDDGNCRLLALPKKVLPISPKDRFMTFVEKTKTSFKDIKDNVLSSSDYETKTAGSRHTPATTPVAEGVYAITTTGRESHLAYIITVPSELGEVQKDIGLRERGSFVTSVKNPQYSGPANTNLPQGPDYPKEILDEFRSLRWMPLQPKLLDYENTQFILIGESSGIEGAMASQKQDQKDDKDTPMGEMDKLEGEDEIRVKHLEGDDAVFADLGLSSQEFPKVPSTW